MCRAASTSNYTAHIVAEVLITLRNQAIKPAATVPLPEHSVEIEIDVSNDEVTETLVADKSSYDNE